MNDWKLDTWKHLNDLCLNWWVGLAMGVVMGAMIMFLLQTNRLLKNARKLFSDIETQAKGQPGEKCLVCHHTRAEGYRFMYPFSQTVCSNCMGDDEVISRYVKHHARRVAEISRQVTETAQEDQDLHRNKPLDPHRGPRLPRS